MDERVVQFRVGVMVLSALLITGILLAFFGEIPAIFSDKYVVHMYFPTAPGVTEGTPIRKAGLLIGRVSDLRLDEQQGGVWVTAELESDVPLYQFEVPRVSGSFLGDATIDFVPGRQMPDTVEARKPIADGSELQGEVAPPPMEAFSQLQSQLQRAATAFNEMSGAVKETSDSITQTSEEWGKVGQVVNKALSGDENRLERLLRKTEGMMENLDGMASDVRSLLGDDKLRKDLAKSLEEFPQTLKDLREAVSGLQTVVDSADRNLANLEGITKPLGEKGETLVNNAASAVERANIVLERIGVVAQAVSESEGTVGQLLNNPDLYQNVNASAAQLNQLLREMKPIIKDLRVFSDKIARHPEVLGVRGAINRSSGLK